MSGGEPFVGLTVVIAGEQHRLENCIRSNLESDESASTRVRGKVTRMKRRLCIAAGVAFVRVRIRGHQFEGQRVVIHRSRTGAYLHIGGEETPTWPRRRVVAVER